jgi:hypothetical protein
MSDDLLHPNAMPQINQKIDGDHNQAISQANAGIIAQTVNINITAPEVPTSQASLLDIGANPYKGLSAFEETDSANFFGRSRDIQHLWEKFRDLQDSKTRLLPIYGPSGSGKSSLVRAGLIPCLTQHPLPTKEKSRIATLFPSTQPLEELATELARIAVAPFKNIEEFVDVLERKNKSGQYDGLQKIARTLPKIDTKPLIVLVDQFEEVYSQCKDDIIRDAMIGNLLYAASDRSQYVSVILTMRSDFLGETQKHSDLNKLFSLQGFLVPAMDTKCLQEAIAQPAELAGYSLDKASINLLVQQADGREGALPLLQFALAQIWEGMRKGELPEVTIEEIGGVGGALAGKAKEIYEKFSSAEQKIVRNIFLRLVQFGDTVKYTRRRELISSLVFSLGTEEQVKQIIGKFADPNVRLITLSTQADGETAEITHEALFEHWQSLRNWLDDNPIFLNWQKRLHIDIKQWKKSGRDREDLLRGNRLIEAEDWLLRQEFDLSQTEKQYIVASIEDRDRLQKADEDRFKREINQLEELLDEKDKRNQAEINSLKATKKMFILVGTSALTALIIAISFFVWKQWKERQTLVHEYDNWSRLTATNHISLDAINRYLEIANEIANDYRRNGDIEKDLAYQRQIRATTIKFIDKEVNNPVLLQKLFSINSLDKQNFLRSKPDFRPIFEKAEIADARISEILKGYSMHRLEKYLEKKEFGQIIENTNHLEFEKQYTPSALQSTYKTLLRNEWGAWADQNNDGILNNDVETLQIPCDLLQKIETMWREVTNNRCGWYDSGINPTKSNFNQYVSINTNCIELNKLTLTTIIFDHSSTTPMSRRLEACNIGTKNIKKY